MLLVLLGLSSLRPEAVCCLLSLVEKLLPAGFERGWSRVFEVLGGYRHISISPRRRYSSWRSPAAATQDGTSSESKTAGEGRKPVSQSVSQSVGFVCWSLCKALDRQSYRVLGVTTGLSELCKSTTNTEKSSASQSHLQASLLVAVACRRQRGWQGRAQTRPGCPTRAQASQHLRSTCHRRGLLQGLRRGGGGTCLCGLFVLKIVKQCEAGGEHMSGSCKVCVAVSVRHAVAVQCVS